jgi:hypothetical protein
MAGTACCDVIIGGEIYIVVGDQRFEAMGDVTITPASVEREANASSGGRLVVTETARPARATITFANLCDADPVAIFNARCHVDVTVIEKSRGFRHLFTKSAVVGTPEINLSTGEVSGIEIATDNYTVA